MTQMFDQTTGARGRSLVVAMALTALLAVLGSASPALASNASKTAKLFAACPVGVENLAQCDYAKSGVGSEFQAGNIVVPLAKSLVLQGGITQNEETGATTFYGAEAGNATTLKPVPQVVPGGLEAIVDPTKLSGSALASYEAAVSGGKSGVKLAIELAGPPTPAVSLEFDCFVTGTCPAIVLPVQVHFINSFLGKNCYVGNNHDPIHIELTTGETDPPPPNMPIKGNLGELKFGEGGETAEIVNDALVNNSYAAPGASNCGTPQTESQVDAAFDSKSGIPSPAGTNRALIVGTLHIASAKYVEENLRG